MLIKVYAVVSFHGMAHSSFVLILFQSQTTAPSSPALKSRRGAILKQNTVDPTTSSSVTNVQRTALELQNTDTARTIVGEVSDSILLVYEIDGCIAHHIYLTLFAC